MVSEPLIQKEREHSSNLFDTYTLGWKSLSLDKPLDATLWRSDCPEMAQLLLSTFTLQIHRLREDDETGFIFIRQDVDVSTHFYLRKPEETETFEDWCTYLGRKLETAESIAVDQAFQQHSFVFSWNNPVTKYDMEASSEKAPSLLLWVDASEKKLHLTYKTTLFREDQIKCILDQFEYLLTQISKEPNQRCSALSLVVPSHKTLLPDPSIHMAKPEYTHPVTRVLEWAQKTPHAPALEQGDRVWSYARLKRALDLLSKTFEDMGVAPGHVIAIEGGPSPGQVVSVLATLRVGAVLLNIDPALPLHRRQLMMREAGVVLHVGLENRIPFAAKDTVDLWVDPHTGLSHTTAKGVSVAHLKPRRYEDALGGEPPNQPAYIFFTSGSTGKPKAVLGAMESLGQYVDWEINGFNIGPGDRCAQLINVGFDAFFKDFFVSLASGATLCLPESKVYLSKVLCWLAKEKISVCHGVPSLVDAWLDQADEATQLPHLRILLCSGEPLRPERIRIWRKAFFSGRLINLYGATETTLTRCWHQVGEDEQLIPAGFPIPDTQVLVLRPDRELCGIGEIGEIVVRTPFRSLGYLNDKKGNMRTFAPCHNGSDQHDLLYFSGDRGRYRWDGSLDVLGRLDDQVKLNGVRLQPREIQVVLEEHPMINRAAIVCTGSPLKLFAFLLLEEGYSLEEVDPHRFLAGRLPKAIVPDTFIPVADFPRLANGKIDRAALCKDATSAEQSHLEHTPISGSSLEPRMMELWRRMLGTYVDAHENLLDLGIHSLRATRLLVGIEEEFKVHLRPHDLFEAPTIRQLCERIECIRNATSEKYSGSMARENSGMKPDSNRQPATHALSSGQKRLWFLDQYEDVGAAYNLSRAYRIEGLLHEDALHKALDQIVVNQPALRSYFPRRGEEPIVKILPPYSLRPIVEDYTGSRQDLAQVLSDKGAIPFNLEQGPLIRVHLLKFGSADHLLMVTIHHIISDAWSLDIFFQELAEYYAVLLEDSPLPTPHPEKLNTISEVSNRLDTHLAFWKEHLNGAPPFLFPHDERPTSLARPGCGVVPFTLGFDNAKKLHDFARDKGATPFAVSLSILAVLLGRHTGYEDLVIGTPVARREHSEHAKSIGFYVNTLALRIRLSANVDFVTLLSQVMQTTLDGLHHGDAPFEDVVAAINPERRAGRSPLFQVMLAYEDAAWNLLLPNLKITRQYAPARQPKFDLILKMRPQSDDLLCWFEYDTSLFLASEIQQMVEHYLHLATALMDNPQIPAQRAQLFSQDERSALLSLGQGRNVDLEALPLVHELFEQQVMQYGEHIALRHGDTSYSYNRLNGEANQLASWLRSQGIGPEVTVAVCMKRCPKMIVALLGILKAGAAYVPMDPKLPSARLETLFQASRCRLLLCAGKQDKPFSADHPYINLNHPLPEAVNTGDQKDKPSFSCTPENIAYVIHTSGSSGTPKPVAISHRALANHMRWMDRVFPLKSTDVVLQKTPFSFDASVWEIFAPLLSGATLALATENAHRDPTRLALDLTHWDVTTLQLVPSQLRLLLTEPDLPKAKSLKRLFCGGEKLTPELVVQCRKAYNIDIVNLYGPTETCIQVSSFTLPKSTPPGEWIPIGTPIDGVQLLNLNAAMELCPFNTYGELYIGGCSLARGYLGQPAKTALSFLPDPYSSQPGARLYRTGDRARFTLDHQLDLGGRMDDQIKVRGYRVEPGEIEAALLESEEIVEAIVMLHGTTQDNQRLVAFVVPDDFEHFQAHALSQSLRLRLPAWMVPTALIPLRSMPMNANGKTDRQKLAALSLSGAHLEQRDYVEPETDTQCAAVSFCQELLGASRIGINDHFFELGGHSLLAARLVSRIHESLDIKLPLYHIFEAPILKDLAARIDGILETFRLLDDPGASSDETFEEIEF